MAEKEEESLELRSEEVQEILSFIPNWIIRWGITVILLTILMFITGTWFIKYPEIINSKVTLITQSPPVRLVSQASGKITLLGKDNDYATKDSYLAVIENPAKLADVLSLKKDMERMGTFLPDRADSLEMDFDKALQLGDLQNDYSVVKQHYVDMKYFLSDNYYPQKIATIENQLKYYENLNEKLHGQKDILKSDLDLVDKKFNNDKGLFKQGVIAELEYNRSQAEYLQKKYTFKNSEITLVNNEIQLEEYRKTIMDLNQQYQEKKRAYSLALHESYKKLENSIAAWEQRYTIKAPIDGTISYFKFYSDNQFIATGDEVLTVVPKSGNVIGKVFLPSYGSGKVMKGQKVNIKLDSYPFKEYGIVSGRVESISQTTRDNMYLINVSLPNGLNTNYRKKLEFKQEMQGTAEIVTKDLRLIERVFNQLRSLIQNSN